MTGVLPCLSPRVEAEPRMPAGTLGDPLLDVYLEFVAARSRPNTVLATWFDLKVFFAVVGKPVGEVRPVDVLGFITAQRAGLSGLPDPRLVPARGPEEGSGVSLRTIRRRLSTIGGLYAFLTVRGDVAANPVPRGLPTRREKFRPAQGVPLVRTSRTLPRILSPTEVDALTTALRTHRDRAMVSAMLLGGLRRCEVLGLKLSDVSAGERQLFVADGKGGHQRLVPVSPRFFEHLGAYLDTEHRLLLPREKGTAQDRHSITRMINRAGAAAGLGHIHPHQLRHTLATQAINRGMSLEAIAAMLGHKSMDMTLVYAKIANRTVAQEYFTVAEKVDALYARPAQLPADALGPNMARLNREHHRMLGNGYCVRPKVMDCQYETICESCTFFATTIEFRPTILAQREDACAKGQVRRAQIYDELITGLDTTEAS